METNNIFNLKKVPSADEAEIVEKLHSSGNIIIERIISAGQTSPENFWYDQPTSEWVILLQGEATIEFENKDFKKLKAGDYLFIPAHARHRVASTSSSPPCIWLAIHL